MLFHNFKNSLLHQLQLHDEAKEHLFHLLVSYVQFEFIQGFFLLIQPYLHHQHFTFKYVFWMVNLGILHGVGCIARLRII
jgi:hypothetical protein